MLIFHKGLNMNLTAHRDVVSLMNLLPAKAG